MYEFARPAIYSYSIQRGTPHVNLRQKRASLFNSQILVVALIGIFGGLKPKMCVHFSKDWRSGFLPARRKFALIPRRGFLAPCGKFPPILPFGDFSHRAGNFRRSSFSGISPRVREISADPACRRFLADTAGLVSSNLYQTYNTILHSSKTCSLSSHLHSRANNTVGI